MKLFICILSSVFCILFVTSFSLAQETSFDKALAAYAKKDFKAAVEYLKEYVAENPEPQAYYLLGYASYKMNNMEESAKYFKEAYLIDPEFDPKAVLSKFGKK